MSRRLLFAAALAGTVAAAESAPADRPPNIVIVFADDLGYGDVGCYGAKGYATPNLDRLAAEGVKFTDFYVAQAVCSSSRAALLTGCYSNRVGITGALGPKARIGLNPAEANLASVLKARGYATGIFGKWHLGDAPKFLPTRLGFDEWYGLPYSNDMWPKHPTAKFPDLPLFDGEQVVAMNPDQTKLTGDYTTRAVKFIERNKDKPFLVYLPHSMPHVPLFASERFLGKTPRGLYGDVISEIDWSVGEVLDALKRHGLDERTLVIFTSDNGPWLSYGDHAGSTAGLREGKGTAFDGGQRVPMLARWPGRIPAGKVCRQPAMTIDVLPTVAALAGAALPTDRIIDGRDIRPLLEKPETAATPHEVLYFYWLTELHALRAGKWKLHLAHPYRHVSVPGQGGKPGKQETRTIGVSLFDLEADPNETTDVAGANPEVVKRLEALAEKAREDLGDKLTRRMGRGVREPGRI